MSDWLRQFGEYINHNPLDFGVRAGGIFVVVVGSLALGRWLEAVISRIPARTTAAGVARAGRVRGAASRWLGRFAFLCVLLAGAQIILLILEYGHHQFFANGELVLRHYLETIAEQIVATLLLVPLTLAVGRLLQQGTGAALGHARLDRARLDRGLALLGGRLVYAVTLVVGALVILAVWGVPPLWPVTLLGAITLALSLALQDVLRNLFAGVYLLIERPFVIGDEIAVDKYVGTVEDIQLRVTSLRAPDGQRVLVPNATLFTSPVVNSSAYQRRRMALVVTLPPTGRAELDLAEERIREAVQGVAGILASPPPLVHLSHVGQDKVDLIVVFWVPAGGGEAGRIAASAALDRVRTALGNADVSLVEGAAVPA